MTAGIPKSREEEEQGTTGSSHEVRQASEETESKSQQCREH